MYPHFDSMDATQQVDLTALSANRFHTETDLRRLWREGTIQRDKGGYYALEKRKNIFGEEEIGPKFYIDDSYRHMERLIQGLYQSADQNRRKMLSLSAPDDILLMQALHTEMLVIDFKLMLLFDLQRGFITDDLWSPQQIDEWLQDQMDLSQLHEMMMNQDQSPLGYLTRFTRMLQFRLHQDWDGPEGREQEYESVADMAIGETTSPMESFAQPGRPRLTLIANNTR